MNVECDICGKVFSKLENLKSHQKMHSDKKPFKCGFCGKSFRAQNNMEKHQFQHVDEKMKCNVCEKTFHNKYSLKAHEKIHMNDKTIHIQDAKFAKRNSQTQDASIS